MPTPSCTTAAVGDLLVIAIHSIVDTPQARSTATHHITYINRITSHDDTHQQDEASKLKTCNTDYKSQESGPLDPDTYCFRVHINVDVGKVLQHGWFLLSTSENNALSLPQKKQVRLTTAN